MHFADFMEFFYTISTFWGRYNGSYIKLQVSYSLGQMFALFKGNIRARKAENVISKVFLKMTSETQSTSDLHLIKDFQMSWIMETTRLTI